MNRHTSNNPPTWAQRFLLWFCRADYLEDIEGDLFERFQRTFKEHGIKKAQRKYVKDVLLLFRPGIIRNMDGNFRLNKWGMLKNYFIAGVRNLRRYPVFSIINIVGLSIGITCCLLSVIYIRHELSYDKYQKNYDRMFRVLHAYNSGEDEIHAEKLGPEDYQVWGSAPVGPALIDYFPQIQSYCRFTSPAEFLFQYNDARFQEDNMVFCDSTAFSVFSWKLLSGNPKTALVKPNSVVLSETTAKKYFGNDDAVGKILTVDKTNSFMVTGVMEDIPENSHFQFDGFISMSTFYANRPEIFDAWGYVDFYTYFVLGEKKQISAIRSQMPEFMERILPGVNVPDFRFEPLSSAYLHSQAKRQPGETGNYTNIVLFSFIAVFILFIACINYMNLSTARSMERAKEIGVRKSIGAGRGSLIFQFLTESIFVSFLAGIIGMGLCYLLLPLMNDLSGKSLTGVHLLTLTNVLIFVTGLILIGLMAGVYPAIILAGFKTSRVLKGVLTPTTGGVNFRKSLVVFQFTLSIALIAGTAIVYKQLNYLQNHPTGFQKDQVLVMDFGWDNDIQHQINAVKEEFREIPGVKKISASRAVPGGFYPNAGTNSEDPEGKMIATSPGIYEIDPDFIPTFSMEMAAGRNFSPDRPSDSTRALLINETEAHNIGYVNVGDAVGKKFEQWGRSGTIIGVVKDFNLKSLHSGVDPLTLRFAPNGSLTKISMTLAPENIRSTIDKLEEVWQKIAPQRPFVYSFLDQSFNAQYKMDERFGNIFTSFSVIAIFIACLGLLGLTIYNSNRRRKEIGIRKVLGATVSGIVILLTRDYFRLFIFALIIASPLCWWGMNKWLDTFAYKTSIHPAIFIFSALLVFVIVISTISIQSFRAATSDPVNSLKDE